MDPASKKRLPDFADSHYAAKQSRIFGTKPEIRTPLFMIIQSGEDVLFINLSDEVLPWVRFSSAAMQTVDDDVMHAASDDDTYEDVLPGEAVKISDYNYIFDSDFHIQYYATVSSHTLGEREYRTQLKKGGVDSEVIQWQEAGSKQD